MLTETSGRFCPGTLVATPGLLTKVPRQEILAAYARHLNCDWGDVSDSDKRANDYALQYGGRLLSVYHSKSGIKFWIVTEADRTATTCLLSSEY